MKILLTGATGYIGKRLLPALVQEGHHVVCCVRDKNRFVPPSAVLSKIRIVEVDFLKEETLQSLPQDVDAAYYLMHSMSSSNDYESLELRTAELFNQYANTTQIKQVIYLTGMSNEESLSKHLQSRQAVEEKLSEGPFALTALRAGIIIGSGSASFEIIRDITEKLPAMITPKWLKTRCQPIGIKDVISFLTKSLGNKETYHKNFDIGGPDILTYKEMLLGYAKERGLKRYIFTVPVMTPKLSSYWLYFVTSTSYKLASSLVESMKIEVVCRNNELDLLLDIQPITYQESLQRTLKVIEGDQIISSWKDSMVSGEMNVNLTDFLQVPTHGCYTDKKIKTVKNRNSTLDKIWQIGGNVGWYYGDWLWGLRGFLDQIWGELD